MTSTAGMARSPPRDFDVFRPADSRIRRDTIPDGFVDGPSPRIVSRFDYEDLRLTRTRSEATILRQTSQDAEGIPTERQEKQKAFKVAQERKLIQQLTITQEGSCSLHLEKDAKPIPNCLGFSVPGDEKQEGPAFNYARVFTWWNMARRLYLAFETTTKNMEERLDLDEKMVPREVRFKQRNLRGDSLRLSRYCGLAHNINGKIVLDELKEYPEWEELDSAFYHRILAAIGMGLFVQWGTTGAAIVISYLTEVRGLGCRSAGYMLYGALGTLSFSLLFISSLFSHAAMLHHERVWLKRRYGEAGGAMLTATTTPGKKTMIFPSSLTALRVLAVLTRMLGRALVVANAIWIILSSLWELVGFYDNCWCDGTFLSRQWSGWVILFKDSSAMAEAARQPWAGGVFLSSFVLAGSCCVFWMYCRGNRA